MNKFYRPYFLTLSLTTVLLSACSPVLREEYLRTANERMQTLAKKYNAKITPLTQDTNLKHQTTKRMNRKELQSGEEELVQLERFLATQPDSLMTYVDLKITAPSEVTRVDSVYFNVNKWNYLQKHGLVTKNTYFLPREAK